MRMSPSEDVDVCKAQLENAIQRASRVHAQAVEASVDVGKEKIQFFEKVGLGSGATIAVVVSFIGAHPGRLHPPWLLRSALVVLVLSMLLSFFRNWRFQFYIITTWRRQDAEAKFRTWERTGELIKVSPSSVLDASEDDVEEKTHSLSEAIGKLTHYEERVFREVQYVEGFALGFAALGLSLLVPLAWFNF
jgi:hypothetical protein